MRAKLLTASLVSVIMLLSLSAATLATSMPIVSSFAPVKATDSEIISVTVTGEKFAKTAYVRLTKAGQTDIMATDLQISKTQLTATLDLKGKAAGKWDIVVGNIGTFTKKEKPFTTAGGFTIENTAPIVKAVLPKSGMKDSTLSVSVVGEYFRKGAVVKLISQSGVEVAASNVSVTSASQMTCDLNLAGLTLGLYDLKVTNDDGKTGILTKVFLIENQPPTISVIVPTKGFNKGVVTISLTGTYLDTKSTGKLTKSGQEIPGANVKSSGSDNLSLDFNLTDKPLGSYDVVVTNPDGKVATLANGFTIDPYVEPSKLLKSLFFDFDKFNIRADQAPRLDFDITSLQNYTDSYILIDGHADERGTRAYNVELAAKRANAIKDALIKAGFDSSKITVNSYGEDYPVKKGHNEASWWYNRRTDISIWQSNPATWNDRIQTIYFDKSSDVVDPSLTARLDQNISTLNQFPNSYVILVANTKDFSSNKDNAALAAKRIAAIKAYLVKAGVNEDRISTIDSAKVNSFFTAPSDAKWSVDRRVDLLIAEF